MRKYQSIIKWVWISLLTTMVILFIARSDWFERENVIRWMENFGEHIRLIYIVFVLVRFVLFIPSTVLVLIGIALFPEEPFFLLTINMLGIVVGAKAIYQAGRVFTPENFFSEKKAKSLPWIKEKINAYGFYIVLLWSFFPLVPTDLISYVAGTTRMNRIKFLSAMILGELILVGTYIFTGKALIDLIL